MTHPKYVKQAKGQKTDFRDAVHMASMFRMYLVVASYISPADIRDLRELCRYRLKLTYMRTSEKNRFQNSMTISKIRLNSVFSDPFENRHPPSWSTSSSRNQTKSAMIKS